MLTLTCSHSVGLLRQIATKSGSTMPAYKLYCVDEARQIVAHKSVAAETDEQALRFAKRIAKEGITAELWARDRLVGHFIVRTSSIR